MSGLGAEHVDHWRLTTMAALRDYAPDLLFDVLAGRLALAGAETEMQQRRESHYPMTPAPAAPSPRPPALSPTSHRPGVQPPSWRAACGGRREARGPGECAARTR